MYLPMSIYQPVYLPTYSSICLSACLSVCLSTYKELQATAAHAFNVFRFVNIW